MIKEEKNKETEGKWVTESKEQKKKKGRGERYYRSEGFDHVDPKSWKMQKEKQRKEKRRGDSLI